MDLKDEKSMVAEIDEKAQILKKEILQRFSEYNRTIDFMVADAPLSVLCLPKATEKALSACGYKRVYDLFGLDFTKVEGLDEARIEGLTSSLDKFLSVS